MYSLKTAYFVVALWAVTARASLAPQNHSPNYYVYSSELGRTRGSDPDADRNVSQLISSKGYPVEEHDVTTADGYILGVQRIPAGREKTQVELLESPTTSTTETPTTSTTETPTTSTTETPTTSTTEPPPKSPKVVLLHHGLIASSADWVINNEKQSLAFILADAGYDVWLANARGNTYSKRHRTLSPEDKKFWQFTWDDIALGDLPATIDYVLNKTGQEQLYYVGHSMGTTVIFALLSEIPEYNQKIKSVMALAPVTTVGYMTSPLRLITPIAGDIEFLLKLFGENDFMPSNALMKFLSTILCGSRREVLKDLCKNTVFLLTGVESKQINESRLEVLTHHTPAGTSSLTVFHYAQMIKSKTFQKFDYGKTENMKRYGQVTPPLYPIENITTPIALFWSLYDLLGDPTDVALLKPRIKNLLGFHKIAFPQWTHLDFVYGIEAKKYVYNHLLALLKD